MCISSTQSSKDPRDWTSALRVMVHVWGMERMAKRGQTWRERDGASVKQNLSQWKHTVTVWHSQPSPPADVPCSQVLSQLITLSGTTPHSQELTAKPNNDFADLGDYCIMGAYSYVQSPVTVTLSQIVNLIIINDGTTDTIQSCESKSLKLLKEPWTSLCRGSNQLWTGLSNLLMYYLQGKRVTLSTANLFL